MTEEETHGKKRVRKFDEAWNLTAHTYESIVNIRTSIKRRV